MSSKAKPGASGKDKSPSDDDKKNPSLETELELQRLKLQDFSDKIELYKERCQQFSAENERLADIQLEINCDRNDIVEFLNFRVGEHEDKIHQLENEIARVEKEKEDSMHACEAESENTKRQLKKELEQANQEAIKYKQKLEHVSDFTSRKEEMEQQIFSLRELLDQKVTEYKETVNELHRKSILDKNNSKIEMARRIEEAVRNFKVASEKQMTETARRAIRENMMVTSHVKTLSDNVLALVKENDELKSKLAKAQRSNALLKDSEVAFAKKCQAGNKTIQILMDKLQEAKSVNESLQKKLQASSAIPIMNVPTNKSASKIKPRPVRIEKIL